MLPKSLHTVRILCEVAAYVESMTAHRGAQAVYAACSIVGYQQTCAQADADPVVRKAVAQFEKRSLRAVA